MFLLDDEEELASDFPLPEDNHAVLVTNHSLLLAKLFFKSPSNTVFICTEPTRFCNLDPVASYSHLAI